MNIQQIKLYVDPIIPHDFNCKSLRKDEPGECNCRQPETVAKVEELVLRVAKGQL